MRINVYSEELTNRVEIVTKEVDGNTLTGVRFYLYLPVSQGMEHIRGPFIHRDGDDDSSAVTLWGDNVRSILLRALELLEPSHLDW